jgi:hypothetical protein
MATRHSIDELKDLGTGRPVTSDVAHLYHQAFAKYGTRALWNWRELPEPTITQALVIADALRIEGNIDARRLAVKIEEACRAAF